MQREEGQDAGGTPGYVREAVGWDVVLCMYWC
jgi:hypothetical protein